MNPGPAQEPRQQGPAIDDRRAILHVDMDAFYASVEVLDDPALRGRPVIVGGTPAGRGVVAAASYEARRFGVHSAMSAGRARRLCPDGVYLPCRMDRYAEVSEEIFGIFRHYTPLVEPLSIDEAFLDVTGCGRLFGPAPQIGRAIKDRIAAQVGLTASVGVAPNKFLAKLASDLEKPDGFVVITAQGAADLLAGLPVGRLWGVGKVAQAQLAACGVRTCGDLLGASPRDLAARFGEAAAHWSALARGLDDRPVIPDTQAKSIGNEQTFAEDIADQEYLVEILDHLTDKVAHRLRAQGFCARTLTLKARYPDFTTHTRSVTLAEPTDSSVELRAAARRLLQTRLGRQGRPLRLIGVTASGFAAPAGVAVQGDLFPAAGPAGSGGQDRDRALDRILDQVQDRYGPKLRRGMDSR